MVAILVASPVVGMVAIAVASMVAGGIDGIDGIDSIDPIYPIYSIATGIATTVATPPAIRIDGISRIDGIWDR